MHTTVMVSSFAITKTFGHRAHQLMHTYRSTNAHAAHSTVSYAYYSLQCWIMLLPSVPAGVTAGRRVCSGT